MKLKTVFVASLLVGGVAFAEDITIDDRIVGVLPLTLTAKETVICVPWIESGNASGGVAVSNLVKTAGLTRGASGDKLYWYDTSKGAYSSWYIDETSRQWTEEGGVNQVLPSDAALNRGDAVILKLASAPSPSITVYIVGQVGTSAATTEFTAPEGCTATNPFYALIAPPSVGSETVDLNDSTWTGVGNEDVLITGYGYNSTYGLYETRFAWGTTSGDSPSSGWGTYSYSGPNKTFFKSATVPRGTGFFYKKCSSGKVTITWN